MRAAEPLRSRITGKQQKRCEDFGTGRHQPGRDRRADIGAEQHNLRHARTARPRSVKEAVIKAVAVELCSAIVATRPA